MRVIVFDLETDKFAPCNMAPEPVCLTWAEGDESDILVGDDIPQWLEEKLLDPNVMLGGTSVSFDFICVLAHYKHLSLLVWAAYQVDRIFCVLVREKLLDIRVGHWRFRWSGGKKVQHKYNLGNIAMRRFGIELDKGADSWRLRYGELRGVPLSQWPERALRYALDDSIIALRAAVDQHKRSVECGYDMPTQFEDTRACLSLRLQSAWGVETDAEVVDKIWNDTIDGMEALVEELVSSGVVERGVAKVSADGRRQPPKLKKTVKVLQSLVMKHYTGERDAEGFPPRTKKKAIMTTAAVFAECDYAPFRTLTKFLKLDKRCSTYLSKMLYPVVHARFDAVGAGSDRTSSSGPNLQNVPPGVREGFRARAGFYLLSADHDTQEMRTLAQACLDICGFSKLATRYQEDRHFDAHIEFASTLAGIAPEEALSRYRAGDKQIAVYRKRSKPGNFGFAGGMMADTFRSYAKQYGFDFTLEEAEHLRNAWFQTWPEMTPFFDNVKAVKRGGGDLRIPRSGFIRGQCGHNDIANGYFQTPAAHATKRAHFEVSRRCYSVPESALYGSRPWNFVHDELILESPIHKAHLAAVELVAVMEETQMVYTPDVPSSASASLMIHWSKSAEPVYRDGILVPWDLTA